MGGCVGLCLQAQEGNIHFTGLAERVEYGNYVLVHEAAQVGVVAEVDPLREDALEGEQLRLPFAPRRGARLRRRFSSQRLRLRAPRLHAHGLRDHGGARLLQGEYQ